MKTIQDGTVGRDPLAAARVAISQTRAPRNLMKYGLLEYRHSINFGDEIQSLAARQHLPRVDAWLDRDYLNTYSGEPVKLIMNGWFMARPQNWPPAPAIDPLAISFHISNYKGANTTLFSDAGIDFFRRVAPIGCRDRNTLGYFQRQGIEAYYSGCLTLTLTNPFTQRDDLIVLNDPFISVDPRYHEPLLSKLVPPSQRDSVVLLRQNHRLPDNSRQKRFEEAQRYLDLYARAKLVITSRIHCALPCLALGTPVYFTDVGYSSVDSRDRFSGLLENLRILDEYQFRYPRNAVTRMLHRTLRLRALCDVRDTAIDWDNPGENPVDIQPLAQSLRDRILEFLR